MTSIYASLAAVMKDVDHVAKRDKNEHQRFMFRGIDAVLNAVGPVLRKHGVIVVPDVVGQSYEIVQTTTGKPATACRVQVAYTFYGPEGDNIRSTVIGEAWDAGDKAAPKAMSVAFRTALLQALALPTDEPDPDTQVYERDREAQPARRQSAPRSRPSAAAEPDAGGLRTDAQSKKLFALLGERGMTDRDEVLVYCTEIAGRNITSTKELTVAEASAVIEALSNGIAVTA